MGANQDRDSLERVGLGIVLEDGWSILEIIYRPSAPIGTLILLHHDTFRALGIDLKNRMLKDLPPVPISREVIATIVKAVKDNAEG